MADAESKVNAVRMKSYASNETKTLAIRIRN